MDDQEPGELRELLRPITSLISKSEKAQQRLAPGTWQHAMLRDNLKALRISAALMAEGAPEASTLTRDDLQDALGALTSMTRRVEQAQGRFSPGTSHYTLQRNRLKALRAATALVEAKLETSES